MNFESKGAEVLYLSEDGEYRKLGKINVSELTPIDTDNADAVYHSFKDATYTTEITGFDSLKFLINVFRDRIPNNWFKMHGIPMRRKAKMNRNRGGKE